jgi:protein TonB
MSRKLREEGVVELAIEVANSGRLVEVRVLSSSGHARLDDAALVAVRSWTFKPRTGDGAAAIYRQRFVFRLKSASR